MVIYFLIPLMSACGAVALNAYSPVALHIVLAVILTIFILHQIFGNRL